MAEHIVPESNNTAPEEPQSNLSPESHGVNPPAAGEQSAPLLKRPDWVPEKFFDVENGVINYKEMAKSYGELEKFKSTPTEQQEEVVQHQKEQTIIKVSAVPGVDEVQATHYTEEITKNGTLSTASYAELAKVGYSKDMVEIYIAGLTRDLAVNQAVEHARMSDKEISAITQSVGGQDTLTGMLNWAKANLSAADKRAYDEAVSSQDVSRVRLAVKGLHASYAEDIGITPQYVKVGGNRLPGRPTAEPFDSTEQVTQAMSSREYNTDPAYRAKVAARLAVSNLFGTSKDYTNVQR